MATYKVIQDVEAEDHILGPLSLRQFIYGIVCVFFLYLSFVSIAKHVAFLLVIVLPPALASGFFAFPFGKDQPTEVWALAKIRFLLKPRKRLWNQSGITELVTITAPKKAEKPLTNGLSQSEVQNRLQALALTIDTRGWAVKKVESFQPTLNAAVASSDRLIDGSSIPQPVPDYDLSDAEDMLDEVNNPLASSLETKINQSTREHRQKIINSLNNIRQQQNQQQPMEWFEPPMENDLSQQLKAKTAAANLSNSNLHTLQTSPPSITSNTPIPPVSPAQLAPKPQPQLQDQENSPKVNPMKDDKPPERNPAILNLAYNDDLSISTLAHQADEVIVNLH